MVFRNIRMWIYIPVKKLKTEYFFNIARFLKYLFNPRLSYSLYSGIPGCQVRTKALWLSWSTSQQRQENYRVETRPILSRGNRIRAFLPIRRTVTSSHGERFLSFSQFHGVVPSSSLGRLYFRCLFGTPF